MNELAKIPGSLPQISSKVVADFQSEGKEVKSFGERVSEFLDDVNDLQLDAGKVADQFARGEIEDIHEVMIASEKASVGLDLVLEIRNKLVEAYREIMRTQM